MQIQLNTKEIITMRDEMVKLEKVKKSCKISKNLSKIIACFVTIGFVCVTAVIIAFGVIGYDKINSEIEKSIESGDASLVFDFDDVNFNGALQLNLKLNEMVKQGKYAEAISLLCVFVAFVTASVAVVFWMLVSIFKMVAESNTPFTVNILKRLKAVFIMVTVIATLASGIGLGVIVGCIGWSLYSIFDYGFVIQQEIDETL